MPSVTPNTCIMIVDDEPESLNVLAVILQARGYRVMAFSRGGQAITAAEATPPDLMLLDIRMPEMDGFEVCRRFKSDPGLCDIPILFLSGLTGAGEKAAAFEVGAVDYIPKPVNEMEVLARVETHLRLSRYASTLETLVKERTDALAVTNYRLRVMDDAKTDWLNMISHELRTPLTGVLGISELLFMELPENSLAKDLKLVFDTSRDKIKELIDGAELFAQVSVTSEAFRLADMPLAHLLPSTVREVGIQTGITCVLHGTTDQITVESDPRLLRRAMTDLIRTATCCVARQGSVTVSVTPGNGRAQITIRTSGPNLMRTSLETFFEIGGQRELFDGGGNIGLRAALASRIVQLLGGDLSVRNTTSGGIEIVAAIPLAGRTLAEAEDRTGTVDTVAGPRHGV